MADFKSLALQYVLADDEAARAAAVAKTAESIKNAPIKSTAIVGWVQSINPWMPAGLSQSEMQSEDAQGNEPEVSVISRAKALEYLADTLELLEKNILRSDQVNLLLVFFGKLYSVDHKAGIMAATKAIRQLVTMKGFRPEMADSVLQSIMTMQDDFRLQTAQTRLEIYRLIRDILQDEPAATQLQNMHGNDGRIALDLIQLCGHERDPKCLTYWFKIIQRLTSRFELSENVHEEIFKSFSAYFPISMRTSATPTGVTVDDLKSAIRGCFAASPKLAGLSFPFLLQKLDQGDAITIPVKTDILRTLNLCLEQYPLPTQTVVPYADRIWSSLKFEVRNGEIKESIECTLQVMRTLSQRLANIGDNTATEDSTPSSSALSSFKDLALSDCLEDLANPTYTRPAGLLLRTIMGAHAKSFSLMLPEVLEAINKNLREPRTLEHARSLIAFMKDLLDARSQLIQTEKNQSSPEELAELYRLDSHIREPFQATFHRFWRENNTEAPDTENAAILKEVAQGFAALVCQPAQGEASGLLCNKVQCEQICALMSDRVVNIFQLASSPDTGVRKELADVVVESLRNIVRFHTDGFASMLQRALLTIKDRIWGSPPSRNSLALLKELLLRLAYIGCSELPTMGNPLQHLYTYISSTLQLLCSFLDRAAPFEVSIITLSGIFSALLHFQTACQSQTSGRTRSLISSNWKSCTSEFSKKHSEFLWTINNDPSSADFSSGSMEVDSLEKTDLVQGYLECGLFLIVHLYQRAVRYDLAVQPSVFLGPDFGASGEVHATNIQDVYLHQLGDMATFVIGSMEDTEQQALSLSEEVYRLFQSCTPNVLYLSPCDNGRTNVLSLGITQGLRPASISPLYVSESLSDNIMNDVLSAEAFPERTQKVRDHFLTILANKWLPKPAVSGPLRKRWQEAVQALCTVVEKCQNERSTDGAVLPISCHARLLAFASGGVARRDKDIQALVQLLVSLPATSGEHGEYMARCNEDLLAVKTQLGNIKHAVTSPLSEQWLYVCVIRPRLEASYPLVQHSAEGIINAIAVVHLLKHLGFSVYEEDVDIAVRLLIGGISSFKNLSDIEAALQVLLEVLTHKPEVLQQQLKAVVAGATAALGLGLGSSKHLPPQPPGDVPARFIRNGDAARCRKNGLLLLQNMAPKFEGRLLAPYKAQISRVLATACGDPVREVRQAALAARSSWTKLTT